VLYSALPHIADTSIMIGEEIGGVGMVVEGQWRTWWRVCGDGFSALTMLLMSGKGRKGRAVLLTAQSSPVVPLEVGRAMLQFFGD
jgi:hypothetical protein